MTKKEIRSEMKIREAAFRDAELETPAVWARIERLPEFRGARTILAYMDIPGEVPTREFIDKWRGGKRIAIPLVAGDSLELYEYDPARLKEGYRGILEPSADAVPVDPSEIDLALVPGEAFCRKDGRLWRLGRGKGFYDRLLARLDCPSAGIFFSFRLLPDLPLDPWDLPLNF